MAVPQRCRETEMGGSSRRRDHGITEFLGWVGRNLKACLIPPPATGILQEHLPPSQVGIHPTWPWMLTEMGQPVSGFYHVIQKKKIQSNWTLLPFKAIALVLSALPLFQSWLRTTKGDKTDDGQSQPSPCLQPRVVFLELGFCAMFWGARLPWDAAPTVLRQESTESCPEPTSASASSWRTSVLGD